MKNLFKLFLLLVGKASLIPSFPYQFSKAISISILAVCPDYPTIPTAQPMIITKSSPGMDNCKPDPFFPSNHPY